MSQCQSLNQFFLSEQNVYFSLNSFYLNIFLFPTYKNRQTFFPFWIIDSSLFSALVFIPTKFCEPLLFYLCVSAWALNAARRCSLLLFFIWKEKDSNQQSLVFRYVLDWCVLWGFFRVILFIHWFSKFLHFFRCFAASFFHLPRSHSISPPPPSPICVCVQSTLASWPANDS